MARLLIYDAYENKVYTYANLNENDPMPYSTGTTLRVREFRGKSASPTLWTTIAAMEAWNLTRRKYGKGIPVGYAFRRIWEGYVMILQDALSTLGYQTGSRIDGIFGARTEEALKGFQRRTSLRVDGVCGCNSWKKISTAVIGVGRTKTTID